jgi:predicted nucleic acid-binding protein
MNALDTNVWVYLHDRRYPEKQAIALDLAHQLANLVLPWQVGCEFVSTVQRLALKGFTQADAWDALADIRTAVDRVLFPTLGTWPLARELFERYSLSFWDSLVIALCAENGVQRLYTEDFTSQTPIAGVEIINPFASLKP